MVGMEMVEKDENKLKYNTQKSENKIYNQYTYGVGYIIKLYLTSAP